MNNDQVTNLLTVILVVMIGILFLLLVIYLILKLQERRTKNKKEKKDDKEFIGKSVKGDQKGQIEYSKKPINSFMKFEKIEDDMIITKNGTKFLMVIECQGVNYDLMSSVEKTSVEQGFLQFLNTLKNPIQIYTQTRTINLGSSISNYKERLKKIENEFVTKQMEYDSKMNSRRYTTEEMEREKKEVIKERNLYEYGRDIINNTERMNLNKNILRKHYYIIIAYTPEEISNQNFGNEEIRDMAFNELYTKCQSAIASLGVCGINGKILNSNELAELLYMAYNRDDADIYQLENALNTRYDELYVTAQDVLDKKMKALDEKIKREAIIKANETLTKVNEETEKEKEVREKEENLEELIGRMAKLLIDENEEMIGVEKAKKAKKKIDEENKGEGGMEDEKKQKTTARRKRKVS